MRIHVFWVWHLKLGFKHTLSSTAQKCAEEVRFYKPCTSAQSENEFDHTNRMLCLKAGALMSRLSIGGLLIPWSLVLACCGKQNSRFPALRHAIMREDNFDAPETPCGFNCVYLLA